MPDIDIDFADREVVLDKLKHRVARLDDKKKHNTGVYVTEVPHNPVDKMSTIDYETAEERGYFKLDFLNVSMYKDIKDEAHLNALMKKEPLPEILFQSGKTVRPLYQMLKRFNSWMLPPTKSFQLLHV